MDSDDEDWDPVVQERVVEPVKRGRRAGMGMVAQVATVVIVEQQGPSQGYFKLACEWRTNG